MLVISHWHSLVISEMKPILTSQFLEQDMILLRYVQATPKSHLWVILNMVSHFKNQLVIHNANDNVNGFSTGRHLAFNNQVASTAFVGNLFSLTCEMF